MSDPRAFYQTWLKPDNRKPDGTRDGSCCSNTDCHPVARVKRVGENWFFFDAATAQWYLIPEGKFEDNQPDPRDSPDGQWHVCNQGATVYCAVRGSGQ